MDIEIGIYGHHSIIAPIRSKRYRKTTTCYFCPGNEHMTPREKGRIEYNGEWVIRWFDNKFPAIKGMHEIVVDTREHTKRFYELGRKHIANLLHVFEKRINYFMDMGSKYVCVFKNRGAEAGASLEHEHTQILALPFIPSFIKIEKEKFKKNCFICTQKNVIDVNNYYAIILPDAPRFNHELWIISKEHIGSIPKNIKKRLLLADMLIKVSHFYEKIGVSYNMVFHQSIDNFHFHIEFLPRTNLHGGFEVGFGEYIISVKKNETKDLFEKYKILYEDKRY